MSNLPYFALWLVAALAVIALLSAMLARQRRLRDARRLQGEHLLDALDRYAEWMGMQRRASSFAGESPEAAEALDEACSIRLMWFPELSADLAELLAMHNRLMNFLSAQEALRLRDPEAWLESDHDGRFMAMWKQQCLAIEAIQLRLATLTGTASARHARESTYA